MKKNNLIEVFRQTENRCDIMQSTLKGNTLKKNLLNFQKRTNKKNVQLKLILLMSTFYYK